MPQINFDATNIPQNEDRGGLVAPGLYLATLHDTSYGRNSKNTGDKMELRAKIIDTPPGSESAKGRSVFASINVTHQNAETQRIGQGELSNLQHSVGIPVLKFTEELHDKQVVIRVGVERSNDPKYADKNKITYYYPASRWPEFKAAGANPGAANGAAVGQIQQPPVMSPPVNPATVGPYAQPPFNPAQTATAVVPPQAPQQAFNPAAAPQAFAPQQAQPQGFQQPAQFAPPQQPQQQAPQQAPWVTPGN